MWDAGGAAQRSLDGHPLQITGVAFTPDGAGVATASTDGFARLWDRASGSAKASKDGFPKGAMCLAMSRDGRMAAVGAADRLIRILDLPPWQPVDASTGSTGEVRCARSRRTAPVASGGSDSHVVVIELESGKRQVLSGHSRCWESPSRPTASGSCPRPSTARCGDGTPAPARSWASSACRPRMAVAFSPDGRLMAAGLGDGTVRFWNVDAVTAAK
jgi:WD40 repeat protein